MGIDPNEPGRGDYALEGAASSNEIEIVKVLWTHEDAIAPGVL